MDFSFGGLMFMLLIISIWLDWRNDLVDFLLKYIFWVWHCNGNCWELALKPSKCSKWLKTVQNVQYKTKMIKILSLKPSKILTMSAFTTTRVNQNCFTIELLPTARVSLTLYLLSSNPRHHHKSQNHSLNSKGKKE